MKFLKPTILVFSFLVFKTFSFAGVDYTWWNVKHNWDGYTPWYDYIVTSSDLMGPNALPVPTIKNGMVSEFAYFKLGAANAYQKGDESQSVLSELYVPLFSKRVGLNIDVIPFEHYKMDTLTRDLRKTRNITGEGIAFGDVYIGTYIQIFKDAKFLPDLLLTINLKTASGTQLADARYTDAPGYFFDLSFGKSFKLNKKGTASIRPHGMGGFYVWQIHGNGQLQNDAILYGLGLDLSFPKLELKNQLGGYYGYLGNGDRPMVYRLKISTKLDAVVNYEIGFQKGLKDYDFTTFNLSCIFNLSKTWENISKNKQQ